MKRIILFALSGLFMIATQAQDNAKTSYSVSGGLLGGINLGRFRVPDHDDIRYDFKAGFAAGAYVNFPIGSSFSIEPQLLYSSLQYETSNSATLLLNKGKISYISLPILLKLHAGKNFAITAGPQIDFLSSVEDDNNIVVKDEFNKTSVSLTGGIEVFPHSRVTLFGRYVQGLSNMNESSVHSTDMQFKNQSFQFGLKLRLFGKKKTEPAYQATSTPIIPEVPDTDGDGIKDDVDKCPNQAGVAKYDGCPIPDSDGDGINDELDKCPNQAGVAKYDGCPIPDSDGDGINDELDKCPNQAGVAKYDGCPVPDTDGDGINDELDKCPDIAGVAANNGCPEVPANVSKSVAMTAQHVSFGSTNAKLTTRSYASLDKLVAIMNENPGLKVKVEGHTDNAGDEDKNMTLSQQRADAVKAYLIGKGVSEDRITAEGFGETMPIADNSTAAGRMKNRRIEIRVNY